MRLQVGVEHRFRGERFVTARAGVRSIAGMAPEMDHQRGSLSESFLAMGALVGPLAGVSAPMNAEIILRDEPFTT